jgi:uncharacterized membrane protein YfcA
MPTPQLLGLAAIALIAFATEGALGFGGTVIAASLGAQLVPLDLLLPAFVPLNLALSTWLLTRGARAIAWRLLLVEVAPPVTLGAAGGITLAHVPSQGLLAIGFGLFVIALATAQLAPRANPTAAPPRLLAVALLVLGGLAHGLFGTGGPMIVYVLGRRLTDKQAFRATLAVLWLVLNLALLTNFATLHRYDAPAVRPIFLTLALTLAPGLYLGDRLHHALPPARFEKAVWLLLLVAGAALTLRAAL